MFTYCECFFNTVPDWVDKVKPCKYNFLEHSVSTLLNLVEFLHFNDFHAVTAKLLHFTITLIVITPILTP